MQARLFSICIRLQARKKAFKRIDSKSSIVSDNVFSDIFSLKTKPLVEKRVPPATTAPTTVTSTPTATNIKEKEEIVAKEPEQEDTSKEKMAARQKLDQLRESSSLEYQKSNDWYVGSVFNAPNEKIPKWMKTMQQKQEPTVQMDTLSPEAVVYSLKSQQARNIVCIDMTDKADWMEYLVIAEGQSTKQVYSMAQHIKKQFEMEPIEFMPHNLAVEGIETDWLTVDLGRIQVHCFVKGVREQYDLDRLWTIENL